MSLRKRFWFSSSVAIIILGWKEGRKEWRLGMHACSQAMLNLSFVVLSSHFCEQWFYYPRLRKCCVHPRLKKWGTIEIKIVLFSQTVFIIFLIGCRMISLPHHTSDWGRRRTVQFCFVSLNKRTRKQIDFSKIWTTNINLKFSVVGSSTASELKLTHYNTCNTNLIVEIVQLITK